MVKKRLRKFMPEASELRRSGALRPFGDWIYASNYWHLNRYSASMAFFVGLFVAFLPVPGQMLIAALLAIRLRCNLPLSVALVWVSNPLTAPPLFYLAYRLGGLLIGRPIPIPADDGSGTAFDLWWLFAKIGTVWPPLLLGCLLLGLFAGSLGYFVINNIWRWRVGRDWRRRQRGRRATARAAAPRPAPGAPHGGRGTGPRAGTAAGPRGTRAQNPAGADQPE